MDAVGIAGRIVGVAREVVAASREIADYDDGYELADDLEAALRRYLSGSSDVDDEEIIFYEEETRGGEPVSVLVTVNPRNQPVKLGKLKVGLFIQGDEDGPTYEDGVWEFGEADTVADVAAVIGKKARKVLDRF